MKLNLFKKNNRHGQEKAAKKLDKRAEKEFLKGENTLKDFLAPPALQFESTYIQIGERFTRTFFVLAYPRYLNTAWFSPIVNYDRIFDVSMFIHPIETDFVLGHLQKKVARVEADVIYERERGQVRDPKKEIALQDMEQLRDRLQTGQEHFFKFGLYITIYGDTLEELNHATDEVRSVFESYLVYTKPALFVQEPAFQSVLPLGLDKLLISSNLNTSPLSTVFPFVSSELSSDQGILYGLNRHNSSLILFDRFTLENANTVIFGKSGAGKSYAVKLEILRSLSFHGTQVIIIDLENEYQYLAEAVDGAFIDISLSSPYHLNPFDMPKATEDEQQENVFRSHIATLAGFFKLLMGGVTPEEDAILDRAIRDTYATRDITPKTDPTGIIPPRMEDFQQVLEGIDGAESIALRMEKYSRGSYAPFLNNYTNVDLKKQLVVFNLRNLEDEFRPVAMFLIISYIWRMVRSELKKRLLIVDEAWWIMKNDEGAAFLYGIAKRARKYFLGLTTITQDVSDFARSAYARPIITNSSLQLLLKQSPAAINEVQQLFNLTDEEKYLLLEAEVGEGLFFAGLKHVAIKVVASYSEDQLITSDPQQLLEIERAKRELAHENEVGTDGTETEDDQPKGLSSAEVGSSEDTASGSNGHNEKA